MADEYSINAKFTADTTNFDKGIDNAENKTKSFSKSITETINKLGKNGLVKSLADINLAVNGVTRAFSTVTKVVRNVSKYVNECTEGFKSEQISINALNTALQNNQYTTSGSIEELKAFASEIQRTTNYGDDYLFPFMTQLISSGRTVSETMKIIKTATNIAASGAMSFESAVQQLNATMNGNIGRLGQQNQELKNLTEEELKNGKAVDILAEKYKGLAESTVDTASQLKNMKGDFKEALGQFTKPSSDLWNKFWTGYYEKGIETIKKVNAFIEAQTIGRKLALQIEKNSQGDLGFIKEVFKSVTDEELLAIQGYLNSVRNKSDIQELMIKRLNVEIQNREYLIELEKEEAEARKAKAKAEQETIETIEEETEKKKEQWEINKENYEKDIEAQQKYNDMYGQMLANRNKKRLEEERKALEAEKKLQEERLQDLKETLNNMIKYTKQFVVDVVKVTKDVFNAIGKVFQKGFSAIKKLASLNLSQLLDNLLTFEDSILTFFVSTIHSIPNFISSVLGSVSKMFKNIVEYLKKIDLKKIIVDMLTAVSDNAGDLVENFIDFLGVLIVNGIAGLSEWIKNGGFKNLLAALLDLQKGLEEIITENIDEFVDIIIEALPDIMETIKESIISASQTFSQIVDPLIKIVMEIVLQLIEVLTSDEVIQASIEAMGKLFEALIKDGKFIEIIISLVKGIINIASNVPELFGSIVQGIFDGLVGMDWKSLGKKIGEGIKDILASIFGIEKGASKEENAGRVITGILTGGLSIFFEKLNKGVNKKAVGSNNVKSGLTLVGEKGPELVDFRGGERIYTAQNTAKILSRNSSGNNFNVTFNNLQDTSAYTMIKELKAYNRNMAINGVL